MLQRINFQGDVSVTVSGGGHQNFAPGTPRKHCGLLSFALSVDVAQGVAGLQLHSKVSTLVSTLVSRCQPRNQVSRVVSRLESQPRKLELNQIRSHTLEMVTIRY